MDFVDACLLIKMYQYLKNICYKYMQLSHYVRSNYKQQQHRQQQQQQQHQLQQQQQKYTVSEVFIFNFVIATDTQTSRHRGYLVSLYSYGKGLDINHI